MTWYYSINTRHSNDNLISVSPAAASFAVDHVTVLIQVMLDKPARSLIGLFSIVFLPGPQNLAAGISDFTSNHLNDFDRSLRANTAANLLVSSTQTQYYLWKIIFIC